LRTKKSWETKEQKHAFGGRKRGKKCVTEPRTWGSGKKKRWTVEGGEGKKNQKTSRGKTPLDGIVFWGKHEVEKKNREMVPGTGGLRRTTCLMQGVKNTNRSLPRKKVRNGTKRRKTGHQQKKKSGGPDYHSTLGGEGKCQGGAKREEGRKHPKNFSTGKKRTTNQKYSHMIPKKGEGKNVTVREQPEIKKKKGKRVGPALKTPLKGTWRRAEMENGQLGAGKKSRGSQNWKSQDPGPKGKTEKDLGSSNKTPAELYKRGGDGRTREREIRKNMKKGSRV